MAVGLQRFRKKLDAVNARPSVLVRLLCWFQPGFSWTSNDESEGIKLLKAVIDSLTIEEQQNPRIVLCSHSRLTRIAAGSGTTKKVVEFALGTYVTNERRFQSMDDQ